MAIYRFVLIALALLVLRPAAAHTAAPNLCLCCHRPHRADMARCTACHRGDDRSDRKAIAHHDLIPGRYAHFALQRSPVVAKGRALVDTLACRRCHRFETKGNALASDLGALGGDVSPQAIADALRFPVPFMPNFELDEARIAALVNAVLAGSRPPAEGGRETPRVVHFEDGPLRAENGFARQCGPCHGALGRRHGGVGAGRIGPNLSGLFSRFYPKTHGVGGRWSETRLRRWLENPRRLRPAARMQPLRLEAGEFGQILSTLRAD